MKHWFEYSIYNSVSDSSVEYNQIYKLVAISLIIRVKYKQTIKTKAKCNCKKKYTYSYHSTFDSLKNVQHDGMIHNSYKNIYL